jgi:hypothetical protein
MLLLLQMYRPQSKTQNEVNKLPPKELNGLPVTNSKLIGIYEMPGKEFKAIER